GRRSFGPLYLEIEGKLYPIVMLPGSHRQFRPAWIRSKPNHVVVQLHPRAIVLRNHDRADAVTGGESAGRAEQRVFLDIGIADSLRKQWLWGRILRLQSIDEGDVRFLLRPLFLIAHAPIATREQ